MRESAAEGRCRMPKRWTYLSTGLAGLIVTASGWQLPAAAVEPIFGGDEILELTIIGPMDALEGDSARWSHVAGTIALEDGAQIPVNLFAYGLSRLEECGTPSLVLEFDPDQTRGTPFEGYRSLRLVRPCHRGKKFETYVMLEYLAYRSYAVVAEPALRTRLVNCRFLDSEHPSPGATRLVLLVEDIGEAAGRHGMIWLNIETLAFTALDPDQVALLALFEYMVGNTDWSALKTSGGRRCCHNIAILGYLEDGSKTTLLPFDFDATGLVDPPYAVPDGSLRIESVTERVYRGFCAHNDRLPGAIDRFNDRRPQLEALFADDALPDPKARAQALKYIGSFFDTINDPRILEKRVLRDCRSASRKNEGPEKVHGTP